MSKTKKPEAFEPARKITDHKLNGLNDALNIAVLDEPGSGGASHKYLIAWSSPIKKVKGKKGHFECTMGGNLITFQEGPIGEAGPNGISNEALLAIVIDRLRSFQAGPFACEENGHALFRAAESLMWLQKRTRDRLARGVEGTSKA
jgi:hypothetical protein